MSLGKASLPLALPRVVSPLLYILYTNDCRSQQMNRHILKFADDTIILGLLHRHESQHGPVVDEFVSWCDKSFLQLNILKQKIWPFILEETNLVLLHLLT